MRGSNLPGLLDGVANQNQIFGRALVPNSQALGLGLSQPTQKGESHDKNYVEFRDPAFRKELLFLLGNL